MIRQLLAVSGGAASTPAVVELAFVSSVGGLQAKKKVIMASKIAAGKEILIGVISIYLGVNNLKILAAAGTD